MTDTKQFLRQFNDYWAVPDVASIAANVTDDIRFSMAGKPPIIGMSDFRKMLDEMAASAGQVSLTIHNVLVDGDRAAVNGLIDMMGDNGEPRQYAFCDIYRLEGGKVAELEAYVVDADAGTDSAG